MDGLYNPQLGKLDSTLENLANSTDKFSKKSTWLSTWMILLALVTTIVAVITLAFSIYSESLRNKNLLFSVYKELSYNKEIVDNLESRKEEFKTPGKLFFKDFQFESYRALLQNMTVRGELAESIMDAYRRMDIMQESIEQARKDHAYSVQYFNLVIDNINKGLKNSIMHSIKELRNIR